MLRGTRDEELFETSAGNLLAYRFTGTDRQTAPLDPVVVFETGLLSTSEHWVWLRRALARDHPVLSYNRAGYGRSEYRRTDPFTLGAAVADLTDLVRGVAGERPVVLVGHSLGGYLIVRALESLRDIAVGAVLIDPSHPAELHRSQSQAEGARTLTFALSLMPQSIRLGLGALLPPPEWLAWLPADTRALALAQYRDRKLWQAGRREWRAAYAEFLNHDGILPKIGVPLRLVAATRTHHKDRAQAELHAELVASAPSGDQHCIDDAEHDELLLNQRPASEISALIGAFVTQLRTTDEGR
ncbi:alpha/beta hydrolase [Streptomyces sp. 7N604]|uniref:alpha/beta hydrolase n=1 Tax=Streptomyces sp. 7N604 TaxID=3457415 RepID=UPI003FD62028